LEMKIFVKVKPNSKVEKIEKMGEAHFVISVKESALENKANFAVIKALADYFKVTISQVRIIYGKKAKNKIFEIS